MEVKPESYYSTWRKSLLTLSGAFPPKQKLDVHKIQPLSHLHPNFHQAKDLRRKSLGEGDW